MNSPRGASGGDSVPRNEQAFCVILPAYMEEGRVGGVVQALKAYTPEVVVVDDGSPDRTALDAEAAGAVVLRHVINKGKGVALNTAFEYARKHGFGFVITMDSDGQHDPGDVPRFVEAYVRTGIPVLVGNRMADTVGMPLVRRMTNQFMSWLLSREMGQYVPDTQCGFRLYRADVIPFAFAHAARYAAESEVLLHLAARGVRIDNVPVATIYAGQKSSIRPFRDAVRFFRMLFRYRKERRSKKKGAFFT